MPSEFQDHVKLFLFVFKLCNEHRVSCHQFTMLEEKLLAVRFKYFPRRIGDDGIEAAAPSLAYRLHYFIKLVGPVEGREGFEVFEGDLVLLGLALGAFLRIPGGGVELDAELMELGEEESVQHFTGLILDLLDAALVTH